MNVTPLFKYLRIPTCLWLAIGLGISSGCEDEKQPSIPADSTTSSATRDTTTDQDQPPAVVIANPKLDDAPTTADPIVPPTDWEYTPFQIQREADDSIIETLIGYAPDLDVTFTNQDGNEINIAKTYAGKTLVISSIYTSCEVEAMCPRVTSDFAWLQKQLPEPMQDDVVFLLVSFDPQRDTPEVLKIYGSERGFKFDSGAMLRGPIVQTRKLLETELQVPIDVDPYTNTINTHAMLLHIINADGYIVGERNILTAQKLDVIADEIQRAVTQPFYSAPSVVIESSPESDTTDDSDRG